MPTFKTGVLTTAGDSVFAIETSGLTRKFRDVMAVSNLDLRVPRSSIFGFLGPNGAGKTTTMRLLIGTLRPDAGRAEVLGMDPAVEGETVRSRVGVVLEPNGLYDRLTGEENVLLVARIARIGRSEAQQRTRALLEEFGLWERRKDRAAAYSRGMRQALALARALVSRPELLFLDEPTSGLDPAAAAEFRDRLKRLVRNEQMTAFFISHNLAEVEQLCAQVGILLAGRLVASGHPNQLRAATKTPAFLFAGAQLGKTATAKVRKWPQVIEITPSPEGLRLTLASGEMLTKTTRDLADIGTKFTEVRRVGASLEEAYLRLAKEVESGAAR